MEEMILAIPRDLENLQLPDPNLLQYYQLLEHRQIWLDSEIDFDWLKYSRQIIKWNAEDFGKTDAERKPIKLFFFSPGGDLDTSTHFLDTIRLSKTKIIGINVGIAMSGGAFTYLACHERLVFPRATFLLHSGGADGISGTAEQVRQYTEQYNKQIKQLKDYLVECGLDKKLVNKKMQGEWYIDANEAVSLGVAHRIIESLDEVI